MILMSYEKCKLNITEEIRFKKVSSFNIYFQLQIDLFFFIKVTSLHFWPLIFLWNITICDAENLFKDAEMSKPF